MRGLLQTINPQPSSPLAEGDWDGPSKPIPYFDPAVASKFPVRQDFPPWKDSYPAGNLRRVAWV